MKKVIVSIIFIFIVTFSLNVFANEKVEMNLNKNSVESGDEITVSINFSREEQVAYAYTAKLKILKNKKTGLISIIIVRIENLH